MICGNCRKAGDMLTARKDGREHLCAPIWIVHSLHKECDYRGSCTCQHSCDMHWTNDGAH